MDAAELKIKITSEVNQAVKGLQDVEAKTQQLSKTAVDSTGKISSAFGGLDNKASGSLKNIAKSMVDVKGATNGLVSSLASIINPTTLIIAGVTAAAIALYKLATAQREVSAAYKRLVEIQGEVNKGVATEQAHIISLVSVIQSETATRLQKITALNELKKANPDYFGQLDLEKGKVNGLQNAYDGYINSLQRSITAKVNQKLLEDSILKKQELVNKINNTDQFGKEKRGDVSSLSAFDIQDIARRNNIKGVIDNVKLQIIADIKLAEQEIRNKTKSVAETVQDAFKPKGEKGITVPKIKVNPKTLIIGEPDGVIVERAKGIAPEKNRRDLTDDFKVNENIRFYNVQLDQTNLKLQEQAALIQNTLSPAFDTFYNSILSGNQTVFQAFGSLISGLIKQLVAAVLKAAALAAIMSIINPASGAGAAAFGGGGIGFKGFFNKFLGFGLAEGGIVPRGFPGDTYPALLTSGETVVPAHKLPDFKGSGQQVFIPSMTLRGQDIVVAFNRANKTIGRNG